jgi:ankyrin repeat protein
MFEMNGKKIFTAFEKNLLLKMIEAARELQIANVGEKLHDAILSGSLEKVKKVIRYNLNENSGYTIPDDALVMAISMNHKKIARFLIDRGANVNAREMMKPSGEVTGNSALIMATENGDIGLVKLLLAKGAEVDSFDINGNTALLDAAARNNTAIVECLLLAGAKTNLWKYSGYSLIFEAVLYRNYVMLQLLLRFGENTEGITSSDARHIMKAAANNWTEGVQLLLLYGLDVNIKDNNGHTMLDYANGNGHSKLADFLKSAGGYATQKAAEFV